MSFDIGAKHVSVADAGTHTLTVYDGDQVVQTYPMSAGSDANPTRNGAHVVTESYRNITMDSSTFGLAVDAPGGYRADVEYAVRISNNGEFVHARPVVGRPAGQQQRVARLHQPLHRTGRLVLRLLPARRRRGGQELDRPDAVGRRRRHLRLGHPVGRLAGRQRAEVSRCGADRGAAARVSCRRGAAGRTPTGIRGGITVDTWLIVLIVVVGSSCCWSWRSLHVASARRVGAGPQAGAGPRAPAGGARPWRPAEQEQALAEEQAARARRERAEVQERAALAEQEARERAARAGEEQAAADELRAKAEKLAPDVDRRPPTRSARPGDTVARDHPGDGTARPRPARRGGATRR